MGRGTGTLRPGTGRALDDERDRAQTLARRITAAALSLQTLAVAWGRPGIRTKTLKQAETLRAWLQDLEVLAREDPE